MSNRLLDGKVALVTGAGRGLGRAFAECLAGLGCNVAIHGMREAGPSEFGGAETLTDVARVVAEKHNVRTVKLLADLTLTEQIDRVVGIGGPHGEQIELAAGDCLLLPAGTGHCLLDASADLLVVGAYPPGQVWDLRRTALSAAELETMARLSFPGSDPVMGRSGPLLDLWLQVS